MRRSDRGAPVRELQRLCNALGWSPPLAVDGILGPLTEDAAVTLYRQHGGEQYCSHMAALPDDLLDVLRQAVADLPRPDAGALLIFGQRYEVPGLRIVDRFDVLPGRPRRLGTLVHTAMLHQSVTSSREATERVLSKGGLGVELLIEADGTVYQYRDIGLDGSAHANERNTTSVGIEVVNPYHGKKGLWPPEVPSATAWKGKERPDTPEQLQALEVLLSWLCGRRLDGPHDLELNIPRAFPTTRLAGPTGGHGAWWEDVGGVIAHGHRPGVRPDGIKVRGVHSDARRTAWVLRQRLGWEGA